jgi:riboflavin synthase
VFTGLVADLGRVAAIERDADGVTLSIDTRLAGELSPGDSVAVNGVCLTASSIDGDRFTANAMHETLQRSSLAGLQLGAAVNLELSLRAVGRLSGHVVQGHVDGVGTVSGVRDDGFARVVTVNADRGLLRYVVEQGSIAVDGVSLTVSALGESDFSVSLIPETLARTTLGALAPGSPVNLEVDVLAKHIERLLGARQSDGCSGGPEGGRL